MAGINLGHRAGSMHVRVYPNTKRFPRELKSELDKIERSMPPLQVQVSKANVHREKVRRSIQAQLAGLRDFEVNVTTKTKTDEVREKLKEATKNIEVDVIPDLDAVRMRRVKQSIEQSLKDLEPTVSIGIDGDQVRNRINELSREFSRLERDLEINVFTPEQAAAIRQRIASIDDELDEMSKDRTVRVDINPFTAWASARLAWLTRPRFVEIIPRVSKVALTRVATMLAALSGARLSYNYMKRFSDWLEELDKKLPRITFGTVGLTTAFSGLMGAISGIVGLGEGLAAILPSFLLIPGLVAGAVMSGVALFVALKYAKEELDELGDSYNNLGSIIRTSFWDEARQPIIDFSNSIMPQLERSFNKTSTAIGRFTAKLAGSFQAEFAGGRLEAMFDGLTDAWDELSKGTDGFAGAVTNLGLVAARYMPRLAAWFVRQADTFDAWLSRVATDGRLDQWIQEAIDSYYALWDVTRATTGIFQGLWRAAEAGGSKGLRGFADMLLRWDKAVNGLRWQETLTAMFRGAGVALRGFGDGLDRVGRMLHKQRDVIEHFMGTAGVALGDFIGGLADAFSGPEMGKGLLDFIDGIAQGLENLEPAFEPLADFLGSLLSFMGEFAEELGSVLGTLGVELLPVLADVFDQIKPKLQPLANALKDAFEGVEWATLGQQVGDLLGQVIVLATELAPILKDVANFVIASTVLEGVATLVSDLGTLLETLTNIKKLLTGGELDSDAFENGSEFLDSLTNIQSIAGPAGAAISLLLDAMMSVTGAKEEFDEAWSEAPAAIEYFAAAIAPLEEALIRWGELVVELILNIENLPEMIAIPYEALAAKGAEIIDGFVTGFDEGFLRIGEWLLALPGKLIELTSGAIGWLTARGTETLTGFRNGFTNGLVQVVMWFTSLPGQIQALVSGAGTWLVASGSALLGGFAEGVKSKLAEVKETIAAALEEIRGAFPFSPAKWGPFSGRGWVSYSGTSVGDTFGKSIVSSLSRAKRNVARSLTGIRNEFASVSSSVNGMSPSFDVAGQFASDRAYSARVRVAGGSAAPSGGMNVVANFHQPEQREQFREFETVLERLNR